MMAEKKPARFDLDDHIKTIVLRRWPYGSQFAISPDLIRSYQSDGMQFLRAADFDGYVCRLHAHIWGTVENEEHYEWPATWWDAVKLRFFPKWALKRWPVLMKEVTAKRGIIYPGISPDSGAGVRADYLRLRTYENPPRPYRLEEEE
jgi:hypothetical protein